MNVSVFTYVIYIRTRCEQLWPALTEPELTRQYWFDGKFMSDWKLQTPWTFLSPDGRIINSGEVVEIQAPNHLVLTWRNELKPALRTEGYSRVVFELEQLNEMSAIRHSLSR